MNKNLKELRIEFYLNPNERKNILQKKINNTIKTLHTVVDKPYSSDILLN